MRKSDSTKQVMAALGSFQAKAIKIRKDSTNPHFKSKYASLASILDEIQPVLTETGLVFTQIPEGNKLLTTILYHPESGEFIEADYDLNAVQTTPQGIGSAITYARRYSLTAILGLNIDDDDDGNAATGNPAPAQQTSGNSKQPPVAQQQPPAQPQQNNGQQQQAQTPYNKKYTDIAAVTAALKSATKVDEVASLYFANSELIDKNEELKRAFAQTRDTIKNQGKTIITNGQYQQVCDRVRKGDASVLQNALNVYILNDGQKEELQHLDKQRQLLEEALVMKYNNAADITIVIEQCATEAQVLKLHKNNAMIIDRDPELTNKVNGKIRTLKTAA